LLLLVEVSQVVKGFAKCGVDLQGLLVALLGLIHQFLLLVVDGHVIVGNFVTGVMPERLLIVGQAFIFLLKEKQVILKYAYRVIDLTGMFVYL
jgi:hypothetical protein